MTNICFGEHEIGRAASPFIVAEAGINHNGDLEKAFAMIRLAREIEINAIKFQTFKANEFVTDSSLQFSYFSQGKEITEPMLEMFQRYEFSRAEWKEIKHCCSEEGIIFLSTPQNQSDLDLLLEIGIEAIKVGSDDFTNLCLLENYTKTKLPLILSTGMADLGEIYKVLEHIGGLEGYPVILLLCTSQYPTPPNDVNMRQLQTLKNAFPMIPMGFSDHTQGSLAASMAVAMGAVFFEKHFTLDHNLPGPDHWFSEDPIGLREWVNSIRTANSIMGSGIVRPSVEEIKMRRLARRSIVVNSTIKQGSVLTEKNIVLKRPGNGLGPFTYKDVLGLTATKDLFKDRLLKYGDFA